MKKGLLLILSLLIFSGCTAEYNLNIKGNNFNEELVFVGSTQEEKEEIKQYKFWNNAFVDDQVNSETNDKLEGVEYYDQVVIEDNLHFKYSFMKNNYRMSNIVNSCYKSFNATEVNGKYVISTSKDFLCFDNYPNLEKVTVKINVDFPVKEHNANNVSGNTYIWEIVKGKEDNSIFIQEGSKDVSQDKPNQDIQDEIITDEGVEEKNSKQELIYILIGLGGFGLVLFILGMIKKGR